MLLKKLPTVFLTSVAALTVCENGACASEEASRDSEKTSRGGHDVATAQSRQNKVLERYWKILLASPREGAAFNRVYYDYVGRGEAQALLDELQTLADKEVGEAKGKRLYLLGLAQIRRSAQNDAIETLREAEASAPGWAPISTTLGKTLATAGRFQEACDAWERALGKELSDDARVEVLEKLGETYVRLDRIDEANAIWAEAVRRYADRVDVLKRFAEIQAGAGRYREAAQLFAELEVAAKERRDVEAEIELAVAAGDMKIRLGERDAAIADFERAIGKLAPTHWLFKSLRDRIEYVLLQRSDYDAALEYYRRIIEKSPSDLDAVSRLASILGALGKYEEAEEALSDALKRAPKSVALRKTALELALTQNRHDVAYRLLTELDELGATDEDALFLWADVAMKNDRLDAATKRRRALEIWSRLVDDKGQNVATTLLVAEKCAQNNFRDDAEKFLTNLLNANPDDFEVCVNVAGFYANGGEGKKSLATLDAFAKRNPKNVPCWLRRAEFLRGRGYLNEAIDAARQAVELAAENFEARLLLIDLETDAGEFDDVESQVEATEAIAETDDEKNRLLAARLRFLEATNRVREYLDSLDATLKTEKDSAKLAETYWRKTTCMLTTLDPNGATEAAIEALELGAFSEALLRKIPEIAAKSQAPERTLVLLELAANKDPANKATYLRAVANVKLELGALDDAAKTARELLELDPGNPANCRACADVLWACGLVDETSQLLKKAAELDDSDKAAQIKLATLFDETGATADAIDVLWPIFEKSTRIEEKLTLIDEISRYYIKLDRFEALKERLESSAKTETERRENAYCLSRAYASIKDYDSARSTLETYLTFVKNRSEDDVFLLNALSSLAEAQNDLPAAIRYQEALCDIVDSLPESERLLDLYRRSDDKSKARWYLTQKILPREPLWRQLETVDVLSSLQKYDEASEILAEIEKKFPNDWEVTSRRVSLAGWTSDENLAKRVAELRAFDLAPSTQASKTTALARNPETPSTTISGDAWRLGEAEGRAVYQLVSPQDLRDFATQVATVVYRDRLTLGEKNLRSLYASETKPQAPTQAYFTLGAALFEAAAWEAKNAPENLLAALETVEAKDWSKLDDATVKERFLLAEYLTALQANVPEFNGLPIKELRKISADAIVEMARRDDVWRIEATPIVLARLATATDEKEIREGAAFLLTTMERSLTSGSANDDKSLWTNANEIVNLLKMKGLNDEAERAADLIIAAGTRDYTIFLNAETTGTYRSFELFAQIMRTAEDLAIKQVRNAEDVERARQIFGAVFMLRLQTELREAFKDCDPNADANAKKAFELWAKLSEKIEFGRSTLILFAQLYRRELWESATPLNEQKREAAKRYEENVYKVLALALETNARLEKAFEEKGRRGAAAPEPLADSLRYLGRDRKGAAKMATFLVNRAIYGSRTQGARSLLEAGKLLEFASGTFFALDVADSSEDIANNGFERVAGLTSFVEERMNADVSRSVQGYGRRCVEVAATVCSSTRNEAQLETPEELKKLATENLSSKEGEGKPEDAKLLIALSILARAEGQDVEATAYLDRLPRATFADVKSLELIILEAFADSEFPETQARKKAAADALLGYRLEEKEATRFYQALTRENRHSDAEKIRRRLASFATNAATINMLLDKMLDASQNGEKLRDEDIVFALKVFKTPASASVDAESRALIRGKALAVLKAGGKLGETQEGLERFLTNAPGAVDAAMRLVEVEIERGELDSAKKALDALESRLPNDPAIYADFALALSKVGEIEKAKSYTRQAFTRKPETFFASDVRPEFWTLADDLAFLRSFDAETLAASASSAFAIALKALDDESLAEEGFALIDRLWNDATSSEARIALRSSGARLLTQTNDARFFPYLRDWLLECVAPNQEPNGVYGDYQDVCRVLLWDDAKPQTLAIKTLNLVNSEKDAEILEDFLTRLREYSAIYQARSGENPARQSGALALEIQLLLKLGRFAEAIETTCNALNVEAFCASGFKNDALSICLAFEYYADAETRRQNCELLRALYESAFADNWRPVYEEFYITKIYPLGAKSENAEVRTKYTDATFSKLRSLFRLLPTADLTSNARVGGSLQTTETFKLYTEAFRETVLAPENRERFRDVLDETGVAKLLQNNDFETATPEWQEYFENLRALFNECNK